MRNNSGIFKFFWNILFIVFSAFLFMLSNPNKFIGDGFAYFSFFIFLPLFIVIHKSNNSFVGPYGFFYGVLAYFLYGFWVKAFSTECLIAILVLYGFYYTFVFLILKFVDNIFQQKSWIIFWLGIVFFEFLRTVGPLGFSYGLCAYSFWKNVRFIQICDIIGVYGFNAIILFPSCALYGFYLKQTQKKANELAGIRDLKDLSDLSIENPSSIYLAMKKHNVKKRLSLNINFISLFIWQIIVLICVFYGNHRIQKIENDNILKIKVAAIQNNEHAWENGINVYNNSLKTLITLTEEALDIHSDIEIVAWPETAIIPAIMYNYYIEKDEARNRLVKRLLNYLNSKNCAFVIGNNNYQPGKVPKFYNSSLFFIPKKNVLPPSPEFYSKMHLIPYSEYIPLGKNASFIKKYIKENNIHLWDKGTEYKVFEWKGLKFSTPICFEDNFPSLTRTMVLCGSRAFINLTNDSWGESDACQRQHLAMAVFRSVENKVPTLRSATSGQTCIIEESGKIQIMAPSFCESFVVGNMSVLQEEAKTFYTMYGDFIVIVLSVVFFALLIMQTILVIIKKVK